MSNETSKDPVNKEEVNQESCESCENEACACEANEAQEEHAEAAPETEAKEDSEVDALKKEIEKLKAELEAAKNDYYKAFADAENRKKRLQQEFETNMKYRIQSFALDILPAIDNFERALAQEVTDETMKSYIKGYQMIYDQIMAALHKEGIEVIPTENQPFDPNFHHAIMVEKVEGVEPGMILQELQKGYKLKDRILRASMVKVSE